MASYLINGQINLNKSNICAQDFIRYMHDLSVSYRLDNQGEVLNMGHYGEMAQVTREAKQQHLLQAKADRPKLGKKQCVNAHNEAFDSNPAINEARANIPANINISEGISD